MPSELQLDRLGADWRALPQNGTKEFAPPSLRISTRHSVLYRPGVGVDAIASSLLPPTACTIPHIHQHRSMRQDLFGSGRAGFRPDVGGTTIVNAAERAGFIVEHPSYHRRSIVQTVSRGDR